MHNLIKEVFCSYFNALGSISTKDSFDFDVKEMRLSYTTDSFVVKPLFFRGGNIGKLSICGTINDLTTAGAFPLYLSASFIIEEGFSIDKLHAIAKSMQEICSQTGAKIVTGDTKVVEKGCVDGLYINTSGIGLVSEYFKYRKPEPEDEILLTGGIGEHGTAILVNRYDLGIESNIISDCKPMCFLLNVLSENLKHIKLMKDPTRGGIATTLNEIATEHGTDIEVNEKAIPIKKEVKAINDILGTDPFYMASEGTMLIVTEKGYGKKIKEIIKEHTSCREAQIIGRFTPGCNGLVYMNTPIGGKRIIPMLSNPMLPRIC